LGRGALLAMLLHAQLIVPAVVLIFVYGARDERNRVEEVDVAFRDVTPEELPPNLPPMDDLTPLPPPITEKRDPQPKKRKDKPKPQPKVAEQKPPPKPEPEAVPVPKPEEPPPPPPPAPKPEPKGHEKMVDVDQKEDDKPPPDAKFL